MGTKQENIYKKVKAKSLSTKLVKRREDTLSIVVWLVKGGIITWKKKRGKFHRFDSTMVESGGDPGVAAGLRSKELGMVDQGNSLAIFCPSGSSLVFSLRQRVTIHTHTHFSPVFPPRTEGTCVVSPPGGGNASEKQKPFAPRDHNSLR